MKGTAHGLWLRRPEDADDGVDDAANRERARAIHKAGDAIADQRPRAHHAHCAFGTPVIAARQRDRAEAGVTPFERRDMPYIIGVTVLVVVIILGMKWFLG
jgi:hypothetical protein